MSLENDVYGSHENNLATSSGRACHVRQVTPGCHPTTGRIKLQDTLIIGTWNVRTLYQKGKIENAKQEMKRMYTWSKRSQVYRSRLNSIW